jgi:hypothetical protein
VGAAVETQVAQVDQGGAILFERGHHEYPGVPSSA